MLQLIADELRAGHGGYFDWTAVSEQLDTSELRIFTALDGLERAGLVHVADDGRAGVSEHGPDLHIRLARRLVRGLLSDNQTGFLNWPAITVRLGADPQRIQFELGRLVTAGIVHRHPDGRLIRGNERHYGRHGRIRS